MFPFLLTGQTGGVCDIPCDPPTAPAALEACAGASLASTRHAFILLCSTSFKELHSRDSVIGIDGIQGR